MDRRAFWATGLSAMAEPLAGLRCSSSAAATASPLLPRIQVHPAGHFLETESGRSMLAGACGVTYGHHRMWGFVGHRNDVINHADRDWIDALQRPAGRQMQFLRLLMESRPYFSRIPDQKMAACTYSPPAMPTAPTPSSTFP